MNTVDIVIQSPKLFQQTIRNFREVAPCPLYDLRHGVTSIGNKFTLDANTCAILAMNNGKSTYLGHFAPEFKTFNFKQKLNTIVENFKAQTGELFAIITGGFDYMNNTANKEAAKSFEQLTEIAEILDKNNAELTIIAGKKTPYFRENLAVTKNKFILSYSPQNIEYTVPTKNLNPNSSINELENFLDNEYGIVEINPLQSINYVG